MDNTCTSTNYIDINIDINIDQFDSSKLNNIKSNFVTESSRDISEEIIIYALSSIDRSAYVINLANLLNDIDVAIAIEESIFEFSLIHITINNLNKSLLFAVYDDKYTDIFMNLDVTSRLNNKTLKPSVLQEIINPRLIAFLSPDQMHPESWAPILKKIKFRETTENNMATTDLYECNKCNERKCKVTTLQLRGADEPQTLFITCLVCFSTFLKN